MKCPKCGVELAAGAKFCGACGSKVEEQTPVQEMPTQEMPTQEIPIQPQADWSQAQDPAPKKNHAKLIGVIAVAAVVALVAIGGFLVFHSLKPDTEKQLVYVKDGVLYYTGNMDKEKDPIEIYDGHEDYCDYDVELSKDQQYLFFICEEDSSERLYRVKLQKLTANEDKNDKYIEEVDSHVTGYKTVGSGKALYYRDSNDLYYYDGKETTDIDGDVISNFRSGDIVYYLKSEGDAEDMLCYFDLGSRKVTEIDDCTNVIDYNKDEVLYVQGEDQDYDLYLAKIGKKPVKLAEGISEVDSADLESGVIYYLRKVETEKSYYDYVEDPYAQEDAKAAEPDVKDFLTASSAKKALDEYVYEAYKEYRDEFYDYYCIYSDEYGMYVYYDYDYDNGKENYYLIDTDKDKWNKLDYEGYQEAYEAYEKVGERIQLREDLKEQTFDAVSYDLCCYTAKGGEKDVVSAVVNTYTDAENQICLYQKTDEEDIAKVCSIDDLSYAGALESYLYNEESEADQPYYAMVGGKEQKLDDHITSSSFTVSDDGKTILIPCYSGDSSELYAFENKSGELKKVGKVCSNYGYGYWDGDAFYYSTDDGDYCVYSNGKSKTILKDVQSVIRQENGVYTAYTDYKDYSDNKLSVFHEKDETTVDRDVECYCYINDTRIVYRKHGDLYVYRGEDKNRRIDRDVSSFWCDGAEVSW